MSFRICCLLAFVPALAGAQTLPALVEEALRNNPEILAAQKRYEAARQRPAQAGSLPDPMVSLGYTSNGWPYPGAGLGRDMTSNAGLMLTQEMPFPGKRKLRTEIAGKEADAEFQQYLATRLSVVSKLGQAYHSLHHALVGIEFVGRYQELLENIVHTSEARYAVGKAAQQDILKAQTQFAIFETEKQRYEEERDAREIEIRALLNRPEGGHIAVPGEVPVGLIPATLDEMLAQARENAPVMARERTMVQRGELAANLARKELYPDYTLSGGYYNQGGLPPMWQMRVDVKIPVRRRAQAAITEQEFASSESRHNYEATRLSLDSEVREQYTIAASARKLLDLYDKSVIPEARLTLDSSLASYQTGSLDFLAVFSNFMNVVDYELKYHEEVMRFHIALVRLNELTGKEW